MLSLSISFKKFLIFQSESGYDFFYVYDGTYESGTRMKTYDGSKGDVSYQWSGNTATFWWNTDSSNTHSNMTAYIDFFGNPLGLNNLHDY